MTRRPPARPLLALFAFALAACGGPRPCCFDEVEKRRWDELPTTYAEQIAFARAQIQLERADREVLEGVMAACRALHAKPGDAEAAFWAAMGCFELRDRGRIPDWLEKDCIPFGEMAVRAKGDDPWAHYVLALNVGLEARDQNAKDALLNVGWILSELEIVVERDESLDEGGPLRVLGLLYLRAPAWPTSIGDEEQALDLLERAVARFPEHPLNRLALAEALIVDERPGQAGAQIEAARAHLDASRYGWRVEVWAQQARELEVRAAQALDEEI